MKVKTSITISADLLEKIEQIAKEKNGKRSEIIEQGMSEFVARKVQKKKPKLTEAQEIELINRFADEHREEILETLEYQIDW